jgi:hypothetical protein
MVLFNSDSGVAARHARKKHIRLAMYLDFARRQD